MCHLHIVIFDMKFPQCLCTDYEEEKTWVFLSEIPNQKLLFFKVIYLEFSILHYIIFHATDFSNMPANY